MNINWQNLRSWNGSQRTGFEKLCCQLANCEPVPQGSKFTAKGDPDAGVECYWIFPNGDEWGWQAKFFSSLNSGDTTQWNQINASVQTAIGKHTRLTKYIICAPVDRADPQINSEKWSMDVWNDYVVKWKQIAQTEGMTVEFEFWGEHEIFERLSREEHAGRYKWWFDKEFLSERWFKSHIEEAVVNAGPRYSPELNVELPIAQYFEGLGRTFTFISDIKRKFEGIIIDFYEHFMHRDPEIIVTEINQIEEIIKRLEKIITSIRENSVEKLDFNLITDSSEKTIEIIDLCYDKLREEEKSEKLKTDDKSKIQRNDQYNYEKYKLRRLREFFEEFLSLSQSKKAELSNVGAILVLGKAGTGKTHLFCDIAERRIRNSLPTVLLFGINFTDREPWTQIIEQLNLRCSVEELLSALEACAQVRGQKAMIMLDALNEGEGCKLWNKYLAGMLRKLSNYPWISIALSVRSSYEELIVPENIKSQELVRIEHYGFAYKPYEAIKIFFKNYKLELPGIPPIQPEFHNPLFLKQFCEGLKNKRLTRVPDGLQGITTILDFYLDSVNEKLSRPEHLDLDVKERVIHKAVSKLAEAMAEVGKDWLCIDEVKKFTEEIFPSDGYQKSLFRSLESEGIIIRSVLYQDEGNGHKEIVHFGYQRFAHHLIVKCMLNKYLDINEPTNAFKPEEPLSRILSDECQIWMNSGIIEALMVQIPELIEKELFDLAPDCVKFRLCREAFINSILWRKHSKFYQSTLDYINKYIIRYIELDNKFLDALLSISSIPTHPYNADFLHNHLIQFDLAKRDAWWSIFLFEHYENRDYSENEIGNSNHRLIDWAWSEEDKSHINDESIRLTGIVLAWFFTTSHRFLRDRATKAMVALMTPRISALIEVIEKFINVNDPYILERLHAVAYGVALRSHDDIMVGRLAQRIYEWVFKEGNPPVHILLRHYARSTIEVALDRGIPLEIDGDKIAPPYKSGFPENIPSKDDFEKWKESKKDEVGDFYWLEDSVTGFGDFARYIIGTNTPHFEWSSLRIGKKRELFPIERFELFVDSLTKSQREAWDLFYDARNNLTYVNFYFKYKDNEDTLNNKWEEAVQDCEKAEIKFRNSLGQKKIRKLDAFIIPYLKSSPRWDSGHEFDLSIAQRWIFRKVFELGWTEERLGEFDKNIGRYYNRGRDAHKPERIGKKYQWLAYHEFLARVADNFEFWGDSNHEKIGKYEGPWQLLLPDIDPSLMINQTAREGWRAHTNTWWFTEKHEDWFSEMDDIAWLKKTDDLPKAVRLIDVRKTEDNSEWLAMDSHFRWEQPREYGKNRREIPYRVIWYTLKSCMVRRGDTDEIINWFKNNIVYAFDFLNSMDYSNIPLGELVWGKVYERCRKYNEGEYWSCDKLTKEFLVTSADYNQGNNEYDCSVNDVINLNLPSKWVIEELGLKWRGGAGKFTNKEGNLMAYDPSVSEKGPGALLIRKDKLVEFLLKNEYDILWLIFGEKNIYGGRETGEDYKGRSIINGLYRMVEGGIKGELKREFVER